MYIAMNRFKIVLGKEKEFEDVWKNRDTHLEGVQGFKNFNLIKGDTNKEYSLFLLIAHGTQKRILSIGPNQKLLDWLIKMPPNTEIYI